MCSGQAVIHNSDTEGTTPTSATLHTPPHKRTSQMSSADSEETPLVVTVQTISGPKCIHTEYEECTVDGITPSTPGKQVATPVVCAEAWSVHATVARQGPTLVTRCRMCVKC